MRAACNHEIQSTGAELTKKLQALIWDIQPEGVNRWRVQPMNVHDEILTPTHPSFVSEVRDRVDSFVTEHKALVPLLAIDWHDRISDWSKK
jgi:DNA polymerase I-like protein with 3'-5' exonuclease and polymerase domains